MILIYFCGGGGEGKRCRVARDASMLRKVVVCGVEGFFLRV